MLNGRRNRLVLTGQHLDLGAEDKGACPTWEGIQLFFGAYEKHLTREIDGVVPELQDSFAQDPIQAYR